MLSAAMVAWRALVMHKVATGLNFPELADHSNNILFSEGSVTLSDGFKEEH